MFFPGDICVCKWHLVLLLGVCCLPTWAFAEFEPSDHRWTIGYENGITVRRFLGENWEIFFGGGPDDYKSENSNAVFRDTDEGTLYSYSDDVGESKREEGFAHLGIGRTLLRDGRFWLVGIFDVKYNWENFQSGSESENFVSENYSLSGKTGHRMITTSYLGLRPSLDITRRITLMVGLGIKYTHFTETSDRWSVDEDSNRRNNRDTRSSNNLDVFGYGGIESVSFAFRF